MRAEPRVIPVLLLQDGKFVKTTRFSDPVYVGDPLNVLSIFNDFEVDEIVILDIRAAHNRNPTPVRELQRYAEECFIPLAYGGGLTKVDQLSQIFNAGYEKMVVNTALSDNREFVQSATEMFGSQAIVASIDVVKTTSGERVAIRGGGDSIDCSPVDWAMRAADLGVGEILLTSVDREGTARGYDLELTKRVQDAVDIPVIAHGGAASRLDLAKPVLDAGAAASAAGSLFVFQAAGQGVLINYPSRQQITRLFSENV